MWYIFRMTKTAYVNVRMEKKLKTDAEKVLRDVGVNASDALTMFYRQVVIQRGIPFSMHVPNKRTRKAIADLEAGKGTAFTDSTKELFDLLEK